MRNHTNEGVVQIKVYGQQQIQKGGGIVHLIARGRTEL